MKLGKSSCCNSSLVMCVFLQPAIVLVLDVYTVLDCSDFVCFNQNKPYPRLRVESPTSCFASYCEYCISSLQILFPFK